MSYHTVIRPRPEQLVAAIQAAPERIYAALTAEMNRQNERLIAQIVRYRLTGKGPFPPAANQLGVRTNRLRSSIRRSPARREGSGIISSIGSNVAYLGAHEFGFEGSVTVRAHTRTAATVNGAGATKRRVRLARRRGEEISTRAVPVRSHERRMRLPERAPIRTEIAVQADAYQHALGLAVQRAVQKSLKS